MTDLDWGAFSDTPPWDLPDEPPAWAAGIRHLRQATKDNVAVVTAKRRLPPVGRLIRVVSVLGPAIGLWYVGARRKGGSESRADLSRRLRIAATKLGPTYIKLAQIISSGEGIFPPELVAECKLCRDRVPAEPWDEVEEALIQDLGPIGATFAQLETVPVAAASIAQVHRATLLDGTDVVVKIQRPRVARLVAADIRVMAWLAPFLVGRIPISALANPPALVELFAETIGEELDFRLEAENQIDIARALASLDQRGWIVPRPHPSLVTRRVLVMERTDGIVFDDTAGLADAGVDTYALGRTSMIAFIEGAFLCGIFHGDLHGGNLFVRPDGKLALLDFGMTGRLDEHKRQAFLRLLISSTVNDLRGQLDALRDLGALPPDADLDEVISTLGLDRPAVDVMTLSSEQLAGALRDTIKALLGIGARMPKELMLFVKNLVFLDAALAAWAPDLDILGEITHIATHFATRHGDQIAAETGVDPRTLEVDLRGVEEMLGGPNADAPGTFTYREMKARRDAIGRRMEGKD